MPRKHTRKINVEGGYYHIYNRGVEKRSIFVGKKDYQVFLNILKTTLSPPPNPQALVQSFTLKGSTFQGIPHQPKNCSGKLKLLAYCLMPNHFHLLVMQQTKNMMKQFMQSLATRYAVHFNKTHGRLGSLFESVYKAVLVETNEQFLHLSRYIHKNPMKFWEKPLKDYPYSSYAEYLGLRTTAWIQPKEILAFFKSRRRIGSIDFTSYESFVETKDETPDPFLPGLTIDRP